jgi:hypothetical protein
MPESQLSSNLLVKDAVCKTVGAEFDSRWALYAFVPAAGRLSSKQSVRVRPSAKAPCRRRNFLLVAQRIGTGLRNRLRRFESCRGDRGNGATAARQAHNLKIGEVQFPLPQPRYAQGADGSLKGSFPFIATTRNRMRCHHYCNSRCCPECIKRFWAWAQQHTNGKGKRKGGPNFYDHVNTPVVPTGDGICPTSRHRSVRST